MTTAARPTWAPAKGGNEQGGTRIFGPSQKYSSRDMAAHTSLKPRKPGQDTQDELQKKNLREELEESERKHYSSKDKSYSYDRDRRRGNQLLLEGGRRDTEIVPRNIDADDSDVEAQSDDERLANHALLKEIREINRQLINTIVVSNDEDVDPSAAATAEGDEGTIFKCSFEAVALSPSLKSQYASGKMSKIPPLKLIVPTNYPESSPILLDMFPVEVSEEYEDLSVKAQSRLSKSLRSISQPMSLQEIARTWDICAHAVISEQAQQRGGGSFSSRYGTWENCLSAA